MLNPLLIQLATDRIKQADEGKHDRRDYTPEQPPNYRAAPAQLARCGTCKHFQKHSSHCEKFNIGVDENFVCDAYEGADVDLPDVPAISPGAGVVGGAVPIAAGAGVPEKLAGSPFHGSMTSDHTAWPSTRLPVDRTSGGEPSAEGGAMPTTHGEVDLEQLQGSQEELEMSQNNREDPADEQDDINNDPGLAARAFGFDEDPKVQMDKIGQGGSGGGGGGGGGSGGSGGGGGSSGGSSGGSGGGGSAAGGALAGGASGTSGANGGNGASSPSGPSSENGHPSESVGVSAPEGYEPPPDEEKIRELQRGFSGRGGIRHCPDRDRDGHCDKLRKAAANIGSISPAAITPSGARAQVPSGPPQLTLPPSKPLIGAQPGDPSVNPGPPAQQQPQQPQQGQQQPQQGQEGQQLPGGWQPSPLLHFHEQGHWNGHPTLQTYSKFVPPHTGPDQAKIASEMLTGAAETIHMDLITDLANVAARMKVAQLEPGNGKEWSNRKLPLSTHVHSDTSILDTQVGLGERGKLGKTASTSATHGVDVTVYRLPGQSPATLRTDGTFTKGALANLNTPIRPDEILSGPIDPRRVVYGPGQLGAHFGLERGGEGSKGEQLGNLLGLIDPREKRKALRQARHARTALDIGAPQQTSVFDPKRYDALSQLAATGDVRAYSQLQDIIKNMERTGMDPAMIRAAKSRMVDLRFQYPRFEKAETTNKLAEYAAMDKVAQQWNYGIYPMSPYNMQNAMRRQYLAARGMMGQMHGGARWRGRTPYGYGSPFAALGLQQGAPSSIARGPHYQRYLQQQRQQAWLQTPEGQQYQQYRKAHGIGDTSYRIREELAAHPELARRPGEPFEAWQDRRRAYKADLAKRQQAQAAAAAKRQRTFAQATRGGFGQGAGGRRTFEDVRREVLYGGLPQATPEQLEAAKGKIQIGTATTPTHLWKGAPGEPSPYRTDPKTGKVTYTPPGQKEPASLRGGFPEGTSSSQSTPTVQRATGGPPPQGAQGTPTSLGASREQAKPGAKTPGFKIPLIRNPFTGAQAQKRPGGGQGPGQNEEDGVAETTAPVKEEPKQPHIAFKVPTVKEPRSAGETPFSRPMNRNTGNINLKPMHH